MGMSGNLKRLLKGGCTVRELTRSLMETDSSAMSTFLVVTSSAMHAVPSSMQVSGYMGWLQTSDAHAWAWTCFGPCMSPSDPYDAPLADTRVILHSSSFLCTRSPMCMARSMSLI